jgi:hypothetical protein
VWFKHLCNPTIYVIRSYMIYNYLCNTIINNHVSLINMIINETWLLMKHDYWWIMINDETLLLMNIIVDETWSMMKHNCWWDTIIRYRIISIPRFKIIQNNYFKIVGHKISYDHFSNVVARATNHQTSYLHALSRVLYC